jgi:hypothetical protein
VSDWLFEGGGGCVWGVDIDEVPTEDNRAAFFDTTVRKSPRSRRDQKFPAWS